MAKIINFESFKSSSNKFTNENNILIIEDELVRKDQYLYLSLINAIDKAGYEVSPAGILSYQRDHGLKETSKITYGDFLIIIQELGNDNVQEIYNYINRKREIENILQLKATIEKENKNKKDYRDNFIVDFLIILFIVFFINIIISKI